MPKNQHFDRPDLSKALWYFYTPTTPWQALRYDPKETASPTPTQMAPPMPQRPIVDVVLNAQLPSYDSPNWWMKPFDLSDCTCCAYYDTWETILVHTVNDTETTVVTGISYEAPGMANLDVFEVQILRDGQVITSFVEMKIDATNPNPAEQFTFGGHVNQLPVWVRVDRNQTLTVRVKIKGQYPYALGPETLYTGDICIFVHGFTAAIFDNRDGAPRPNEAGALAQANLAGGPVGEENSIDTDAMIVTMDRYLRFMLAPNPPGMGS